MKGIWEHPSPQESSPYGPIGLGSAPQTCASHYPIFSVLCGFRGGIVS